MDNELADLGKRVEDASIRISKHIRKTPLLYSCWLSESASGHVYLKMESEQVTNSFKARGACNVIMSKMKLQATCTEENREPSRLITASSGNHGLACAHMMSKFGSPENLTVYVASSAADKKIKTIQRYGAKVVMYGSDCVEAENEARRITTEENVPFISPYNDINVVIGQGTAGKEIFDELPSIDAVFVPVGGGGLISGIGIYLKSRNPEIKVIGCQPVNSCVMYHSIKAGKILDLESLDTLSDGTAGGIEPGSITFDYCQKYIDDWILVTEEEIEYAIYKILDEEHKVVEGAAGVAIASFLKTKDQWRNKNCVILICGANIAASRIATVLNKCSG